MFDNKVIQPVRQGKPHITFIDRYWRVSAMPKPRHKYRDIFLEAHRLTQHLNSELHRSK